METLVASQIAEATERFDDKKYSDVMESDGKVEDTSVLREEEDAVLLHAKRMYDALRKFIETVILHKKFFPNCAASRAYLNTKMIPAKEGDDAKFNAYCFGITDEFVTVFSKVQESVIKKRDVRVLDTLDAVAALHIFGFKTKFNQLKGQGRTAANMKLEVLWTWLEKFKNITDAYDVYTTLPKSVYTAVRAKTAELRKKFNETGELDGDDLNIFDIGTSVLGMSGADDKLEFEHLLEKGSLNITQVAKLVILELKHNGIDLKDVLAEGLKATTGIAPTAPPPIDDDCAVAAAEATARVVASAPPSLDLGVLGK